MISVVIPTLNEEALLKRCIENLVSETVDCEIIVADGGSDDDTVSVAAGFPGISIVQTDRGRGRQLNAGAAGARGDILLFLHADTVLDRGWSSGVMSACKHHGIVGGAFTFRIDYPGVHYRLTEHWVKLRCGLFSLPYGDQGIFIKRDIFEKLGGYREIALMEDVDLIERMKRLGKIMILGERAHTHARKWAREGWFRTSVRNQIVMIMYRLGVDPSHLARIYYRGA